MWGFIPLFRLGHQHGFETFDLFGIGMVCVCVFVQRAEVNAISKNFTRYGCSLSSGVVAAFVVIVCSSEAVAWRNIDVRSVYVPGMHVYEHLVQQSRRGSDCACEEARRGLEGASWSEFIFSLILTEAGRSIYFVVGGTQQRLLQ
ncbi:unnamed protein product [Hapterophycus canaliculatus]